MGTGLLLLITLPMDFKCFNKVDADTTKFIFRKSKKVNKQTIYVRDANFQQTKLNLL
jgi:hypothetical protein